jgi:chromate transporter
MQTPTPRPGWLDVGRAFLGLGVTAFGGPVAHIGYFHRELVERRGWLSPDAFAEIVALSQALPGPSSSQAGLAIGYRLAGWRGALAAFIGFTTPSALLMLLFAAAAPALGDGPGAGWLDGLKAAAGAIVLMAVLQMARQTAPDLQRGVVLVAALLAALGYGGAGQLWILAVALVMGAVAPPAAGGARDPVITSAPSAAPRAALIGGGLAVTLFLGLLALAVSAPPSPAASAYGAGALVFGGGHAVLPLLEGEFVGRGWLERDAFVAGYGAAQALPGPLFAFGAYLGAVEGGLLQGVIVMLALFAPGVLLVLALEPLWPFLRRSTRLRGALTLAGTAATGLLAAAFLNTVAPEALSTPGTTLIALGALIMLAVFRLPAPLVVAVAALAGQAGAG